MAPKSPAVDWNFLEDHWRSVEATAEDILPGNAESGFIELGTQGISATGASCMVVATHWCISLLGIAAEEVDGSTFAKAVVDSDASARQSMGEAHGEGEGSGRTAKKRKRASKEAHEAGGVEREAVAHKSESKKRRQRENRRIKRLQSGSMALTANQRPGENDGGDEAVNRGQPGAGKHAAEEGVAWRKFGLHEKLEQALLEKGFTGPLKIQAECLPPAIQGRRDIIGAAETGSGKTLAYALPALQSILTAEEEEGTGPSRNRLRCLVVCPTRELAMQVTSMMKAAATKTDIRVTPVVGGIAAAKQRRFLSRRPEIVVATPGRLSDLMAEPEPHLQVRL